MSSNAQPSSFFIVSLLVVLLAILTALTRLSTAPPINITLNTPGDFILGKDTSYDIVSIEAPTASGSLLVFLSNLLTSPYTPLGSLVRRHLLNQNGIAQVSRLGLEAMRLGYPLIFQPMVRLETDSDEERIHSLRRGASGNADLLKIGFAPQKEEKDDMNDSSTYVNSNQAPNKKRNHYSRIEAIAEAYRTGQTTPTQLLQKTLQRIHDLEQTYGTIFTTIYKDQVLQQANESTKRHATNTTLSILDGIPIAIKDQVQVKNYPLTKGTVNSSTHILHISSENEPFIERFLQLGAIIVGVTVMPEYGTTPLGWSAHYQGPRNAHDPQRLPGGSSSGSAVAVALGIVPLAVGLDGGGSIRIPSSMEGVVGLAPTFGRVQFLNRNTESLSVIKVGPIASTTYDAAIGFAVMAESENKDDNRSSFYRTLYGGPLPPVADLRTHILDAVNPTKSTTTTQQFSSLHGIRLGVFHEHFNDADPLIVQACNQALSTLVNHHGVELVPIQIPHMRSLSLAHGISISNDVFASSAHLYHNGHELEAQTRILFGIAYSMSGAELVSANALRGWALEFIRDGIMKKENITAIVSPTIGAFPTIMDSGTISKGLSDTNMVMSLMKYIFLANLLGFPGVTVPIGSAVPSDVNDDESGKELPIGLHFMANHWNEADLLALAALVEESHSSTPSPDFIDILSI